MESNENPDMKIKPGIPGMPPLSLPLSAVPDFFDGDPLAEIASLRLKNLYLQEYVDRIFGISSAIIYVLDASGRFLFVNRAVEEILNFSTEELIGKHFSFILPPDEYERVSREVVLPRIAGMPTGAESSPKLFDERRRGARRTRNMEVKLMTRRLGDFRIMVGDVTGIVDVEGAYAVSDGAVPPEGKREVFLGSQGVIFDITKYKQAEFERLEIQKRLFQIQKMDAIGKLSGRVAHDLNNKLGSIIGTVEIIKQCMGTANPALLSAYLDTILSASKHASELSNRLSDFSRRGESPYEELDFHKVIGSVMSFLESIASKNVSVRKVLLAKRPTVTGSETMLQNALLNLIVNAFEAMRRGGGTLTIETGNVHVEAPVKMQFHATLKPGRYLLVSVQDTGEGMDEEVRKRIFEPFFTTNNEIGGLGLGLVSIRECVRSHAGVIDMQSEVGKGSRFDIYFPQAAEGG
ncbi:MAG: PAS domain S-box protein [Chitinispirillales bacterium]|jgi:PAS domain S-box-containing protein|nr:PAS domain S-box protein [Chitinispirillales bacterium]